MRERLKDLNTKAYYLLVALSFVYRTNPTVALKWAFTLTAVVAVLPVQDYVESPRVLSIIRGLKVVCLVAALGFALWWVWGKNPIPAKPVYERVVRVAMPHDLNPHDSVICVGAHDENGVLYDLGCNTRLEQEPMVGIYKARFSENPDLSQPHIPANIAGSTWGCRFAQDEITLVCDRKK